MSISRRSVAIAAIGATVFPARSAPLAPLIGVLTVEAWDDDNAKFLVDELARRGYARADRIRFMVRVCGTDLKRLDAFAAEMVAAKVTLILSEGGTPSALAAKRATTTIPIVMTARNPVEDGLVATLARPGGNVTGSADVGQELVLKRLELLLAAVPTNAPIGYLVHPVNLRRPSERATLTALEAVMRSRGSQLVLAQVREVAHGDDLDYGLSAFDGQKVGGALITNYATIGADQKRVADILLRHRLPAMMEYRGYADNGVLMTYSESLGEAHRRTAGFVLRILEGANPRDLPVEQPQRFELVINMKTAKALGISIPKTLLVQADELIT